MNSSIALSYIDADVRQTSAFFVIENQLVDTGFGPLNWTNTHDIFQRMFLQIGPTQKRLGCNDVLYVGYCVTKAFNIMVH